MDRVTIVERETSWSDLSIQSEEDLLKSGKGHFGRKKEGISVESTHSKDDESPSQASVCHKKKLKQ